MLKFKLAPQLIWFCLIAAVSAVDDGTKLSARSAELLKVLGNNKQYSGCILPPFPDNGDYTIYASNVRPSPGTPVDDLTILLFTCKSNLVMEGENTLVCNNGAWTRNPPKCVAKTSCDLPEHPVNGQMKIVGSSIYPIPGHQVDQFTALGFICNSLFDLVGEKTSVCRDGQWSNDVPICEKSRRCLVPQLPERGSYAFVNPSEVAVPDFEAEENRVLQYNCPTPYTLIGESTVSCLDGNWLPAVPECIEILDCSSYAGQPSGIYEVRQPGGSGPFQVFCDLELIGGNWTLFQQRVDGSVDFYRKYAEYTEGFGSLTGSHWLGLEKLHQLTKNNDQELYVDLEAFNGSTSYARFSKFSVGDSSSGFKVTIEDYEGTAGDSLTYHSGMKFSTYDFDQDLSNSNCAISYHGGFWYNSCYASNLNGLYFNTDTSHVTSVHWYEWLQRRSLKTTRMLFRKRQ